MARQLIMVHFKEGGAVACLPVRLFDNGLKAEIRNKNTVIVAHNLGGRWVDNALYNEEIAAIAAQGEEIAAQESGESTPAAPAINLTADVFNLDYSTILPRALFRGNSAQHCLIENIHLTTDGATLEGTVHTPRGDLIVRIVRTMWLACAFSPIESEAK